MKTKAEQDEHLRQRYRKFKEERNKKAQEKKQALGNNIKQGTPTV
jgi:hypothetical protein